MNIVEYASKFVGLPYIWGGEHPSLGYDCSGLLQEVLSYCGMDPIGDQSAQELFTQLARISTLNVKKAGSIVFYGKSINQISHVAFMIGENHMCEAGGGDSTCVDKSSAIARGAFVRIRLIDRRKDIVAVLLPKYPEWVLNELKRDGVWA